jgi:hypothetical protein
MQTITKQHRSLRRHHRERLKRNRMNHWGMWRPGVRDARRLGMVTQTPAPCSCWCCGNPRRVFKGKDVSTRQELSHDEAIRHEVV